MKLAHFNKLLINIGAALAVSAAIMPLAAAQNPTSGGALVIITTPEPAILTNALSSAPTTAEVATKIFDGLFEYDMDLQPIPSLATEWDVSEDGKTVTFKLREGVKWHDGDTFTSEDVAFSLLEVINKYQPRGTPNIG